MCAPFGKNNSKLSIQKFKKSRLYMEEAGEVLGERQSGHTRGRS
jgi:hypothetical protein